MEVRSLWVGTVRGAVDIYIVAETRGARIEWFKFGAEADKAQSIGIDQLYKMDSIRVKNGTLALDAVLDPVSAMDSVTWSALPADIANMVNRLRRICGISRIAFPLFFVSY